MVAKIRFVVFCCVFLPRFLNVKSVCVVRFFATAVRVRLCIRGVKRYTVGVPQMHTRTAVTVEKFVPVTSCLTPGGLLDVSKNAVNKLLLLLLLLVLFLSFCILRPMGNNKA